MHVMLFLAGLIALGAGITMLAFGIPVFRPDLASPLVISATISILGGFVLLGLGTIVSRLGRVAELLEIQPVPRSLGSEAAPALQPGLAAAMSPSLEPPVGSPGERNDQPRREQLREPTPPLVPIEQPRSAAASRLPPEATGSSAAMRTPPTVSATGPAGESAGQPTAPTEWPRLDPTDRLVSPDAPVETVGSEAAWSDEQEPGNAGYPDANRDLAVANDVQPAVLKSGVIEGMAYTLYSDGSVEAELPQGTRRFESIAEWRMSMRALS